MKVQYQGAKNLHAPVEDVHRFLTDVNKVGSCTPDLVSLNILSESRFDAVVKISVGPVRGRSTLQVSLGLQGDERQTEITIHGEGLGSAWDLVGQIELAAEADSTRLNWTMTGTVSGMVASVGGRLLDSQAKRLVNEVFNNIAQAFASVDAASQAENL